jgi:hypothetical protein
MLPTQVGEHHEASTLAIITQAIMSFHSIRGDRHIHHLIVEKDTLGQANAFRHILISLGAVKE